MLKSWIVLGIAIVVLSAATLTFVVLPKADPVPTTVAGTSVDVQSVPIEGEASTTANALATIGAGVGLAAGLFLIGIGIGHWKRPMPSPADGRPKI